MNFYSKKFAKQIITDLERRYDEDLKTLKSIDPGLRNYICDNNLFFRLFKLRPENVNNFHLEVNLADHCNLNCAHCDHFAPLAEEYFLDVESFEKDMKQLAGLSPAWGGGMMSLLGGEALLHKDLVKFLEIARRYFPHLKIMLWTNGLLLKNNDNLFKAIKKFKIHLEVTSYPIDFNYKETDKMAKKYKILYHRSYVKKDKQMDYFPLNLNGDMKYEAFIKCCHFNECRTLRHGKIYTCPIIPYSRHFSKYFNKNLEITSNDYIDIYKVKGFDEIAEFCAKRPDFCRYCDTERRKFSQGYKRSEKSIKEWI